MAELKTNLLNMMTESTNFQYFDGYLHRGWIWNEPHNPQEMADEAVAELVEIIDNHNALIIKNFDLSCENAQLREQNAHLEKMLKLYREHSDHIYKSVMNGGTK